MDLGMLMYRLTLTFPTSGASPEFGLLGMDISMQPVLAMPVNACLPARLTGSSKMDSDIQARVQLVSEATPVLRPDDGGPPHAACPSRRPASGP